MHNTKYIFSLICSLIILTGVAQSVVPDHPLPPFLGGVGVLQSNLKRQVEDERQAQIFEVLESNIEELDDNSVAYLLNELRKVSEAAQVKFSPDVARNGRGETLLMFCARNQYLQSSQFLIDQGASKDLVDSEGRTAADLAYCYSSGIPLGGSLLERICGGSKIAEAKRSRLRKVAVVVGVSALVVSFVCAALVGGEEEPDLFKFTRQFSHPKFVRAAASVGSALNDPNISDEYKIDFIKKLGPEMFSILAKLKRKQGEGWGGPSIEEGE